MTKQFISNCLFEALKAKLKDPRHVTIHVYPKELRWHMDEYRKGLRSKLPHFIWFDSSDQTMNEFAHATHSKLDLLFKGRRFKYSIKYFKNRMLQENLETATLSVGRLCEAFEALGILDDTDRKFMYYHDLSKETPSIEDGLPYTKNRPYVLVIDQSLCKSGIVELKEGKPFEKPDGFGSSCIWKYVSPYMDVTVACTDGSQYNDIFFTGVTMLEQQDIEDM